MKFQRLINFLIVAAAVALLGSVAAAADPAANWPQFRGPLGSGVAPLGDPPIEWSADKNIQWKVKLPGSGKSAAIVWGDYIYTQTAIPIGEPIVQVQAEEPEKKPDEATPASGEKPSGESGQRRGGGRQSWMRIEKPSRVQQFALLCLDRKTGQTLWQRVCTEELPHEGHHGDNGYSSQSPVTDGTCVIAWFGSRGLHCFDMQGNLKWSKDLGDMKTDNGFGEGNSPALFGNTVVVNWDHEGEDFIAAFDKQTGDEKWRQPREEGTTWATPLVVEVNGRPQVVQCATKRVRSYDLATGEPVWDCEGLTECAIPTPITADGMVYVTSGFRGSKLLAIRLDGAKGDLTETDAIAWRYDKDTPYVPSPLLYGDRFYFYKSNNAVLSCINVKSGSLLFGPERLEGFRNVYASPVAASNRIYLTGRDGTTVVIRNSDKLEVLAANKLGEEVDATPSIVGKQLFVRGNEHLYCLSTE